MANNMTKRNRKDRKNKTEGGKRKNKTEGGKRKNKTVKGGKRKLSKGASDWNKLVMKVHKELKSKDKNSTLRDAMVEAAKRKKKDQL